MENPNYRRLFSSLLLMLLSFSLSAQDTQIVNSLNNIIKPVETIKADCSFNDIDFLRERLKEKEIISLGEVTHGTREVFAYKDRLIRYLVSNLNYKTIVFESDYTALEILDNYINGKIESASMSPHYKPLLEWLKAYNITKNEGEKVHLYGLEIRELNPAIDKVLGSNKDLSQDDREIFLKIRNTPFDKIDKKSLAKFRTACTHLPVDLYQKMLIQLVDNFYKFIGKKNSKIGIRDAFMAENAIALKQRTSDKKMIIWAHNGHVAKTSLYNEPAMGKYLKETFQDKYYVIATDINKGNVSVRKFIAKNKPASNWQPIYYSDVDSDKGYEYYFKQCRYRNFILDVHAAMNDKQLRLFLTEPKEMRMIGALSVPANKRLSIAENFDMIVYFNETNSL